MRHFFNSALLLASAFTLMSCEEQAPVTPPPTEVFVISAEEHPYKPTRGFNARIDSRSDVKIQAQVSGKLVKIHFREGDSVKKGTPLFDIDAELLASRESSSKPSTWLPNTAKAAIRKSPQFVGYGDFNIDAIARPRFSDQLGFLHDEQSVDSAEYLQLREALRIDHQQMEDILYTANHNQHPPTRPPRQQFPESFHAIVQHKYPQRLDYIFFAASRTEILKDSDRKNSYPRGRSCSGIQSH
mgnify:CR=1 FL=1